MQNVDIIRINVDLFHKRTFAVAIGMLQLVTDVVVGNPLVAAVRVPNKNMNKSTNVNRSSEHSCQELALSMNFLEGLKGYAKTF